MRRLARLISWVLLVNALIAMFGPLTAPLLLVVAADVAVGALVLRESGAAFRLRPAAPPQTA